MSNNAILRFEPLRSAAFGAISGTYSAIGTAFLHPVHIIMVDNFTDGNLTISFDGVHDHMIIATASGKVIDYATNRVDPVGKFLQPAGTVVWVKGTATVGSVYVSVMYASAT